MPLYHDRLKPQELKAKAKCLCEASCPAVRRVAHTGSSDSTGKDAEQDDALQGGRQEEQIEDKEVKKKSTHTTLTSFAGTGGKAFL